MAPARIDLNMRRYKISLKAGTLDEVFAVWERLREHSAAITFDDPLSAAGQIAVRFSIPMVIASESIGAEIK